MQASDRCDLYLSDLPQLFVIASDGPLGLWADWCSSLLFVRSGLPLIALQRGMHVNGRTAVEIWCASYMHLLIVCPMSSAGTVHIVDDDPAICDSLRVLLEAFGFAVRTYGSAGAFLDAAVEIRGCVLTDVRMPDMDGLELQKRLREAGSWLPVIVMTGQGDIPVAVRAMKAGAVDFLEKPFDHEMLLNAVRRALDESLRRQKSEAAAAAAAERLAELTPREREVFDLLVKGLSTKAIANQLRASPRTIEVHRGRVFDKLEAHSLPDLVRLVLTAEPEDGRHH